MKRYLFAQRGFVSGMALFCAIGVVLGFASAGQASDGSSVTVAPTQAELLAGEQLRVLVTVKDDTGALIAQPVVKYGVEPTQLGVVDVTGLFTAQRVGSGKIVTTVEGHRATTDVNVTQHAEAMDLELWPVDRDSISDEYEITTDETVQLEAVATDRFGNEWDATTEAIFSTNNPEGAFIQSTFIPGKLGTFEVKAGLGDLSDINLVTIGSGALYRVSVDLKSESVSADGRIKLTAMGYDADNHGWDVTKEAVFATTDPKGSIRNGTYFPGAIGTWLLSAEADGIKGSNALSVKAGKIQTISLLPIDQEIRPGGSIHYQVFALDADENAWDVTSSSTFESDAGRFYKNRLDVLDQSGTWDVAVQYQDFLETTTVNVSAAAAETNIKVESEGETSLLDAFAPVAPISPVLPENLTATEATQPELTSGTVEAAATAEEPGQVLGVEDEAVNAALADEIEETESVNPSLGAPVTSETEVSTDDTTNTNTPAIAATAKEEEKDAKSGSSTGAWITIGIILALGLIGIGVIGLTQRRA